jgi:DNA polymerase-3 subunit alpha
MVFVGIEDVTGGAEVVAFNSVYVQARELLVADRVLVVKGRVDHKQAGETKLLAMDVSAFEAASERRDVRLKIDARHAQAGIVRELASLLREYPGEAPVLVLLDRASGPQTLQFGSDFKVHPDGDFFAEVKALLGESAVL